MFETEGLIGSKGKGENKLCKSNLEYEKQTAKNINIVDRFER